MCVELFDFEYVIADECKEGTILYSHETNPINSISLFVR